MNSRNEFITIWKEGDNENFRGYWMMQIGLLLMGVQSEGKTCEILDVDRVTLREVVRDILKVYE
jgi:hypothetical protein